MWLGPEFGLVGRERAVEPKPESKWWLAGSTMALRLVMRLEIISGLPGGMAYRLRAADVGVDDMRLR
jgi:hypothetical protein